MEFVGRTAFGEELTSATLSPWRFSSKRIEEETGLIFFGRRYYLPSLGRWITQDPQGFDDGPNLYAYLSNCPLIRIDPYGLAEFMPAKFDYRLPCFVDYERSFWNKCCTYDLSILRKPELSNGCIFFANGMLNKLGEATRSLSYISDCSGGYNIQGLYNPTHGLYSDLKEASWGLDGVRTNPVQLFKDEWAQKLADLPPEKFALHICHSHSAIYTNLALQDSPDEIRKRVRVVAFAPADYIAKDICHSVQHYEAPLWRDLIPRLNWRSRWQNRDSTTVLPSHPNASWHDHSILSPTFEQVIKDEIDNYLKINRRTMILRLTLCVLFCFLFGCKDSKSEIDKISDRMLGQLSKQMKKKGLIAIGSGGGCTIDKKINLISMTFKYQKVMSMNEARELLVESIQTLLNLMNTNPENDKYFERFPAPVSIILISILGETCPQNLNCIEVVKIINGTVYYNVNHPMPHVAPYLTIKEESFEEAQQIVASRRTHGEDQV